MKMIGRLATIAILGALDIIAASAADWPQWRGPNRDAKSSETGLLAAWPEGGPEKLWRAEGLGDGYGSPAIKDGRVFVQGSDQNASVLFCLDEAGGELRWTRYVGVKLSDGKGDGPRSTPTVDGDRVYVLTGRGDLACFETERGKKVWSRNILKDYRARNIGWGISESPLVEGRMVIVSPGGRGATMVALDKLTGKEIWRTRELRDGAAHSSAIAATVGDKRVILNFTDKAGIGVDAETGRVYWRYKQPANRTANCTTPIFHDDSVFYTSAYGTGGGVLKLEPRRGGFHTEQTYFNRTISNHHGGVVLVGGYLYGFSGRGLTCMEYATGKEMWKNRSVGKGSLAYADGLLYLLGERNVAGLAEATPEGYREKGRFKIEDRGYSSWAHPAIAGGRLYIRNRDVLECYDVRGGK